MGERSHNTMSARYLTSDPTVSLSTVRDGRPVYDFAAAPSLFLEEDLRQEEEMLRYRQGTCAALKQASATRPQPLLTASNARLMHRQLWQTRGKRLPSQPRLARSRFVLLSSVLLSRLLTLMLRHAHVLLWSAARSSSTCFPVLLLSRSAPPLLAAVLLLMLK